MAIEVFISYSHKDQALRDELEIHLSNLKRQDIISSWYDGDITPGAEWEPQIMERLTSAQLILLLISADFIHSDFCYSIEMKQAIDKHNAGEARVIPIVLRPTDWQGAPFDKLKMCPRMRKPSPVGLRMTMPLQILCVVSEHRFMILPIRGKLQTHLSLQPPHLQAQLARGIRYKRQFQRKKLHYRISMRQLKLH